MSEIYKSSVPIIEAVYESLTPSEKDIANFFMNEATEDQDFSSKAISAKIHVSESSLTRFAKKCGFSGYREFIFDYQSKQLPKNSMYQSQQMKRVLVDYNKILDKAYSLIEVGQIERLATKLSTAKKVFIYGKGSSGFAAQEMKIRFMRMGLHIEAISDDDVMLMNHVLVDQDTVVIGFTISGETPVVLTALKQATLKGAYTAIFTAQVNIEQYDFSNIITVANMKNLNFGNRISPQLPLLIVTDIIYDYFMELDSSLKDSTFQQSLESLHALEKKERK
ncbi:MurR/RpiR family transcriptional regulator [Aerococcaceae bacterium WGS1372]